MKISTMLNEYFPCDVWSGPKSQGIFCASKSYGEGGLGKFDAERGFGAGSCIVYSEANKGV